MKYLPVLHLAHFFNDFKNYHYYAFNYLHDRNSKTFKILTCIYFNKLQLFDHCNGKICFWNKKKTDFFCKISLFLVFKYFFPLRAEILIRFRFYSNCKYGIH